MGGSVVTADLDGRIMDVVQHFWGFESLRPWQREAIRAGLEQRDSLLVLPTGGGKSLCYQVPPVVAGRMDVVVSPLISLMKDQVDGLRAAGYTAGALHSQLTPAERSGVESDLASGECSLLFVSPERLVSGGFLSRLKSMDIRAFAIDEAHCISHWGHDFRPEYRQLASLKERFPDASIHAFTATATPRVQQDIVEQLQLEDPNVMVGSFDRPNLTYRIVPRVDLSSQVIEVVRRHPSEAVIVYCMTRKDTERLSAALQSHGIRAAFYHAGMESAARRKAQEAFSSEALDVVVATVAFGMGIDRSDVRCVVHASMPKSIEHYQQETGRAGRDGLEAECVLLYSAADGAKWRRLMEQSAMTVDLETGDGTVDESALSAQVELLDHMQRYCAALMCRHRSILRYFGQEPEDEVSCGACDVCLDEVKGMPESTTIARKILSCVARLGQRYGVGHVVQVLRGADTDAIRRARHDELSTHGLLSEFDEKGLRSLVYQLVDHDLLRRTPGDRPVLHLTEAGVELMRGQGEVQLREPVARRIRKSRADDASWEGVDRDLFEALRSLRRELAQARGVPPYVVFGDRTLRELARVRPSSVDAIQSIHGIGDRKREDFGEVFIEVIVDHCAGRQLSMDVPRLMRIATRLALAIVGMLLGGCAGLHEENAGFTISMREAEAVLEEMRADPRPFERPVVVLGGYLEPGFLTERLAGALRKVTTDDTVVVSSGFLGETDFDGCRERVTNLIARTWPNAKAEAPVEIDIIGFSMGGLVGRLCAIPEAGDAFRIGRLYTISSPHRGARMASLPAFDSLARNMRTGSEFLGRLDRRWHEDPVEIIAYTRLDDGVVGSANTRAPDGTVWWVSSVAFSPSHRGAMTDARIVADIARRLRGEPPLTGERPVPLPGAANPEPSA